MNLRKQLPIGIQDFKAIRDGDFYYVDKSMFIANVLWRNDNTTCLYTRPPRFGKSLNLSMLDAFLNIEYKGNTWFDGLEISKCHGYDEYKNAFPVIYLDLSIEIIDSFDEFMRFFNAKIDDLLEKYQYLEESSKMSDIDKTVLTKIRTRGNNDVKTEYALTCLTSMLKKHHEKRTIVLIDELDAPIKATKDVDIRRKISSFMNSVLLPLLKGNDSLQMCVMMGVLQVTSDRAFNALNIMLDNITDMHSDMMFGFTDSEVKRICEDYGHPEKFAEAKEWYDGYNFGNDNVYNPWSILNYVQNGFEPAPYWVDACDNKVVYDYVNDASETELIELETLCSGGSISDHIHESLIFLDLDRDLNPSCLMAVTGYLKATSGEYGNDLYIPNKEVFELFTDATADSIFGEDSDARTYLRDFSHAVTSNDVPEIRNTLDNIMACACKCHVFDDKQTYRMFIVCILMALAGRYKADLDFNQKDGLYSISIESNSNEDRDLVISFKRSNSEEQLECDAKDVIEQLRKMGRKKGMKDNTVLYCASFPSSYIRFHSITEHMDYIPISVQDFKRVRNDHYYFVDKSMLIGQMLDQSPGGVFLYTRPRRFGKSLNLSMMDAFFNIEYKDNTWFDGLKISEHHEYDSYKNAYPVISIDLKIDNIVNFEKYIDGFNSKLSDVFDRFEYLLNSPMLTDRNKESLRRIFDEKKTLNDSEGALKKLCSMLEKHHGKKVIVLIDEYDAAVNSITDADIRREIVCFMKSMLSSLLKENESLQMGVITGVMQITKENIFSGLNNLFVNNIFSKRSDEMFGFTDGEVKQICEDYGHPEKFTEAKEWYDGYRFGNVDIYNPWSILNYIANGFEPGPYWVNTSNNNIIGDLLTNADESVLMNLETLGSGESMECDVSTSLTFDDLNRDPDAIYSLMAMAGYLRVTSEGGDHYLSIPNRELFSEFAKFVSRSAFDNDSKALMNLRKFCKAVISNNTTLMESMLYNLIVSTLSSRVLDNEHSYQTFIAGMLMMLLGRYRITADFESGNGYHDIRMENKSGTGCNIIMELKRSDSESRLESDAKKALEQIKDRDYAQGLKGQTILYGISFLGKKPYIVSETL